MSSMKEIKNRKKSIKSTKQITKAMNLVSASKLQKAKDKLENYRFYFDKLEETMASIIRHTKGVKHYYLRTGEVNRKLYILISSDRGLCGGYNSNVLKEIKNRDDFEESLYITVGKKAKKFAKKENLDVLRSFTMISESPEFKDARNITMLALDLFQEEKIDEIDLVYTKFKTTLNQEVEVKKLLPVNLEKIEIECKRDLDVIHSYEPGPEEVLRKIIPQHIEGLIYGGLVESSTSEQGSRMTAMDTATQNAEELIEDLTLEYNRKRQAAITQEIAEVVGGAEALN